MRKDQKRNISTKPLETIDSVIEEKDFRGGTGANFIIIRSVKETDFQDVMISTHGQQGMSDRTYRISIGKKNKK